VVDEAPFASPVAAGEIVAGKYRVERVLGVGGMGVVVSARHTTLDQVVAIKLLVPNQRVSHEEAIGRFLDEARAAARIESDYVCRVFDVGTLPNGIPFMVMEHLEGRDLDEELVQRGQLAFVEAVDYVLQAADALAAAHQLGIVHRDIKPGNLFLALRPDGSRRVKVLDFGISKAHGSSRRTQDPGSSLGTPAYMSPEQVRAESVDARADIWGLGAILYELVTGQMAFVGDDVKTILDHVTMDDPCPMVSLRRDVPPEMEAIVMRCLERDRDARWPSAARFAHALSVFGSPNTFAQLASVQRELGSASSISVRTNVGSASSVEPMVSNVRPIVPTAPDPEEMLARGEIAQDWSKQRARKRTARFVLLGLLAACSAIGVGVGVVRLRALKARGDEHAAALASAAPLAVESANTNTNASASASANTHATANASANAESVYSANNYVQSARSSAPRPPAAGRPATRPAPKGSVNHLLDTRD
jgi:serine/threonine-protein kinase